MGNKLKFFIALSLLSILLCGLLMPGMALAQPTKKADVSFSEGKAEQIEAFVHKQMKEGKIPGISVVIVEDAETLYKKGFGYADVKTERPVTGDTLFELGSTSKAFTALGILQLHEKGLLDLEAPVSKYLPWFKMRFREERSGKTIDQPVDITLEQLLHHTSGIPFKTIGEIPIAGDDGALERTVRAIAGQRLDFYPGERYLYATINYDVLGLIIQKVTGLSYEKYMKDSILALLGFKHTYLFRNEAASQDMSTGYKVGFLRPGAYDAPAYRGNTPAGYIITNAEDMALWLKTQLGTYHQTGINPGIIEKSHIPDRSVQPHFDGSSYAAGWAIYQNGSGEISHGGSNPNFSSFIVFRPVDKVGVAVLANLNSANTTTIGQGIMDILMGKNPYDVTSDIYRNIDNISFTLICMTIPLNLMLVFLLFLSFVQVCKKQRKLAGKLVKTIPKILFAILFLGSFTYCLYNVPDVLFWGLTWSFVKVWAPITLIIALISLLCSVLLFCIYYIFTSIYTKGEEKSLLLIVLLSTASGLGNALIIFIINEALSRSGGQGGNTFQWGLGLFFLTGIVLYVYGQRLVRMKLITIINSLVYQKRVDLIDKILNTSYQKLEDIENGKIYAALNNDTETVSNFANIFVTGFTNIVTLVCCFIYLGIINLYGLIISVIVIALAAGLYFMMGRISNKLWEQTRDIQNAFFNFITDLVDGFKELCIHRGKRNEFQQDVVESCENYRDKRILADSNFANAFVVGELLFIIVIGVVTFAFPLLFKDIQNNALRNYVFVFLYMTGPVNGVLNLIPNVIRVKISWKRLNELVEQIDMLEDRGQKESSKIMRHNSVDIELKGINFQYKGENGEVFSVGPIDYCFKAGQIVFITGGNGSGKSTLAKLITGLYTPDSGSIHINGTEVGPKELGQKYSAVFSNFHIFKKLYGIEYGKKSNEIKKYLHTLNIDDKVQVENGEFSTIKLSTGQRKRLALLTCYLEERPVILFDEWAAEQDPEFRNYFYNTLLPELKGKGKCIIAITHDDRYFGVADRLIKMEMGKIIEKKEQLVSAGKALDAASV